MEALTDFVSGKTPAVKNIEAAYTRAGATANHTPGVATKLGSQDQEPPHEYEMAGVGSEKFKREFQDQKAKVSFELR